MNIKLIEHYRKIQKIRDEAVERLVKEKIRYVESGGVDDFILFMYDKEIEFIQLSVKKIDDVLN